MILSYFHCWRVFFKKGLITSSTYLSQRKCLNCYPRQELPTISSKLREKTEKKLWKLHKE